MLHEENNNKEVESAFSNAGVFSKPVYWDPLSKLAERRKRRKTLIGTNHTENMTWDEVVPLLACNEKEKTWRLNTLINYLTKKDFDLASQGAEITEDPTNNKRLSNCQGVYELENTITDEELKTICSASAHWTTNNSFDEEENS